MAASLLRAFGLASPDTREQVIIGIAERLGEDELRLFQEARRRLEHRVDILCGTSRVSRAQLPHEIQLQIVSLLGVTDLYHCTNVCRRWRCLLLQSSQLSDNLLKKHFPGFFDDTYNAPETLPKALRKRYLRDSARFRTRFTCGLFKNPDGTFAMDRVEGLHRGRTFKDLACAGSISFRPSPSARTARDSPPDAYAIPYHGSSSAVSNYSYSSGYLVWQSTPAPGEWAHPIIVHDFRAHQRWDLSLPSMRTKGIKLLLCALGNELVVARVAGERIVYAWDLVSRAVDRVTLPTPPSKCFTRNHSVVIVSQSGDVLLWSFRHGLEDVDTTIPKDESAHRGSQRRRHILNRPLSILELNELTIMFHPRHDDVFFLATYNDKNLNPDELWVCEYRDKRCCQIFTYRVPILWHRPHSMIFSPRLIDAHGTYRLLEQRQGTREGVQIRSVTFNTISKSFGALGFQAPNHTDAESFLLWNDQMVLKYDPEGPLIRPWPLLVVGPSSGSRSLEAAAAAAATTGSPPLELAMECLIKAATSLETASSSLTPSHRLRTMIEALEHWKQRHDIIRAPDVPESMPEICTTIGLRHLLLFYSGQCNWEGDHVRDCPGMFGLPKPLVRSWATDGDDDFLVILNQDYYTVLAVDEDGEVAKAIRESTTHRAEEVSNESGQHMVYERLEI
ncbi:hypothetical protein KVR01_006070 [Diaporthe batatas]|uniref:uncharacterized protein n=1 Tax=Diaporthe batatas TaxID=748121 RepID=UPI001D04C471|nr:uncharacterized protein KVR01_006070 [Diaporthe batatas]KAG8164152.1 hypothetical protein KVR01_006070 [Diaporthe batatas]